jgi:hypothetical protein
MQEGTDFRNRTNNTRFKQYWRKCIASETKTLCTDVDSSKYHIALTLDAVDNKSSHALFENGFEGLVTVIERDRETQEQQTLHQMNFDPIGKYNHRRRCEDIISNYKCGVNNWLEGRIPKLWNFDFDTTMKDAMAAADNIIKSAHQSLANDGTLLAFTFVAIPSKFRMQQWEGLDHMQQELSKYRERMMLEKGELLEQLSNEILSVFNGVDCIQIERNIMSKTNIQDISNMRGVFMKKNVPGILHWNPNDEENCSVMMTIGFTAYHPSNCPHEMNPMVLPHSPKDEESVERERCLEYIIKGEHGVFNSTTTRNLIKRDVVNCHERCATMAGAVQSAKTRCQCEEAIINIVRYPSRSILFITMPTEQARYQTLDRFCTYRDRLMASPGFKPEWRKFLLDFKILETGVKPEHDMDYKVHLLEKGCLYFVLALDDNLKHFLNVVESDKRRKAILKLSCIIDEADLLFPCLPKDLETFGCNRARLFYNNVVQNQDVFYRLTMYTATPASIFLCEDGTERKLSDKVIRMENPENYRGLETFDIEWQHYTGSWEDANRVSVRSVDKLFEIADKAKHEGIQPLLLVNLHTHSTKAGLHSIKKKILNIYGQQGQKKKFNLLVYDGENQVSSYKWGEAEYSGPIDEYKCTKFKTPFQYFKYQRQLPVEERYPMIFVVAGMGGRCISFCSEMGDIRIVVYDYSLAETAADVNVMQEQRYLGCYDKPFPVIIYCTPETSTRIINTYYKNQKRIDEIEEKEEDKSILSVMLDANYEDDKPLVNPRIWRHFRYTQAEKEEAVQTLHHQKQPFIRDETWHTVDKQTVENKCAKLGLRRTEWMTTYHRLWKPEFINDVGKTNGDKFPKHERDYIRQWIRQHFNWEQNRKLKFAWAMETKENMNRNPLLRRAWQDGSYGVLNTINVDMSALQAKTFDTSSGTDYVYIVEYDAKYDSKYQFEEDVLYLYHTFDGYVHSFYIPYEESNDDVIENGTGIERVPPPSYQLVMEHKEKNSRPGRKRKRPEMPEQILEFLDTYEWTHPFTAKELVKGALEKNEFNAVGWKGADEYQGTEYSIMQYEGKAKPAEGIVKYLKMLVQEGKLEKSHGRLLQFRRVQ